MPFTQEEIDNMRANGVPGLHDAPKDPHAERKELEKALNNHGHGLRDVQGNGIAHFSRVVGLADLSALVAAARKHLDTLPKPRQYVLEVFYGASTSYAHTYNTAEAAAAAAIEEYKFHTGATHTIIRVVS